MKLFGKDTDDDLIIVAEIGVNHEGSLEKAKELLVLAHDSGADACKIQVGDVTSGPERKGGGFALDEKNVRKLAAWANFRGIPLFASALSVMAVDLCAELFPVIKVAARDFEDVGLMLAIKETGKPAIASVGKAEMTHAHIWTSLLPEVALLHCVQEYPTPPEHANMEKFKLIKSQFQGSPVGYSNHVIGAKFCYTAVVMGASIIEVHFTDDKTREFRDHQMSFEAAELKEFVKNSHLIREHVLCELV